jgi:sugar O-acyltransferase (sialic acid O-acetyltransferase NeuD family)
MQHLLILGTGGSAHDVLDIVEAINRVRPTWEVAGFLADDRPPGAQHLGYPVVGPVREADRHPGHWFVNAIGSDRSYRCRPDVLAGVGVADHQFAVLIHPAAEVSSRAALGPGTYVCAQAVVAGGVTVGRHVTLGPGCIVGHDAVIDDYAILAPGAVISGAVRVGRCCYVGARAVVRQRLTVGEGALAGMGAVVIRDVPAGHTVVGNPARLLERADS